MNHRKQTHHQPQPEASKNVLRNVIALAFVTLAALICVKGNLDVLSGKSPLDVIPSMLAQGVELILKAKRAEKSIEECDRKSNK